MVKTRSIGLRKVEQGRTSYLLKIGCFFIFVSFICLVQVQIMFNPLTGMVLI